MKFSKIIFLRYIPLTKKIYEDFYMEVIQSRGIVLEYWDLSELFFKSNYDQEDSSHLVTTLKFKTYIDFEKCLDRQGDKSKTLFISIMTFNWRIKRLYLILKKYECILGVFGRNIFPVCTERKSLARVFSLNPFKLRNALKNTLNNYNFMQNYKRGKLKKYDIVFLGGKFGWQGIGQISWEEAQKTDIVKINSDDYDRFLENKDCDRIIQGKYILFLDSYLPFHPDAKLFGIKTIQAEKYFIPLNDYFSRVEDHFGVPVIVAAHPKAIRYADNNHFDNRQIIFNKTVVLSKYAEFVISHASTAINYPIAFNVRLHFITSENIRNSLFSFHNNTIHFANYLGCNFQWFDKKTGAINVIKELPYARYEQYKYDFMTSKETENSLTKNIFMEYL
jgi:hypothetical protein